MRKLSFLATACFAILSTSAFAQLGNEFLLYDGTTEFTSRGTSGTDAKWFLERLPGDQVGGATTILEHSMVIQDQQECTIQTFSLEVRIDNGAGAPDVTPAGAIVSGSLTIDFPTSNPPCGPSAVGLTVTWATPVAIPFLGAKVPNHDLYLTINTPAEPLWTADGLSQHCSATSGGPGEQMKTTAVGYTGAVGVSGLGWQHDATTGVSSLGSANRAWNHGVRFADDVLQRFADNAAAFTGTPNGLNPNFGYAGIWPDGARVPGPDLVGARLRSSAPVGTASWLLASLSISDPPLTHAFVTGAICLGLPFFHLPPIVTTAGGGQSISEGTFGPYPIPAGLPVGLALYAQAASLVNAGANFQMSTTCTGYFW